MMVPIKVILTGDGAVGKTTLRRKFMGQTTGSRYLPTLGAEISINNFYLTYEKEKYNVKVQIWDIAGQKTFARVRPMYYKGSQGIFLVYDITRPESFANIEDWITNISEYLKLGRLPIVLIANKADLKEKIKNHITLDQGEELASKLSKKYTDGNWDIPVFETSALRGENVEDVFREVARLVVMISKENEI
ncbi:MAG: Rab family GTPase [Candidatus Hodarchaeales archaeon]|jgi:small GTP-binding protein